MDETPKVLVPGVLGPLAQGACALLRDRGFDPLYLGPVADADIDCGYAHIDNDVCVSTVAVVGQYIRALRGAAPGTSVLAPELCKDCRSISIPDLIETAFRRADLRGVAVVGFSDADMRACAGHESAVAIPVQQPAEQVGVQGSIGVCGVVPILTTHAFNGTVVDYLAQSGIHVVMPPLQQVVGERDAITPALRHFDRQGVTTVVCLVPFGCLSGHVFARGRLRALMEEFPALNVTVLDYDPSASDINLVNRTELIIQSAKEAVNERLRQNIVELGRQRWHRVV